MASTINPPSKTVSEWCSVFKAQGTESYTSSVTFIKQLTVVAVSTIMYMRNTVPDDSFTESSFGGVKHKILKKKCDDETAQFISTSLAQAFDAFDKKYLHQLVVCFYEDECKEENLLEYYIFEYTYTGDGVSMNVQSRNQKKNIKCTFEDIKKQTSQLMRACLVMMSSMPVLPDAVDISLRLYYNDETPEGYQAPGYLSVTAADPLARTRRDAIALGAVSTPHHRMVARSYVRDMADSGDVEPSETVPAMTQSAEGSSFQRSMSEASTNPIRCPCKKYEDIGEQLITCSHCATQQHAACFGYLPQHVGNVTAHTCTFCSDTKQLPYSDNQLAKLNDRKRECLCIFRRSLAWLSTLGFVSGAELGARLQLSATNVTKLMKLLNDDFAIIDAEDNDLMTPKKINAENLKLAIKKYFLTQDSIADNLISETFNSQESSDPIGEVLSPMEKVNLQNDSNIGRVIPNPELKKTSGVNDEILQQYKDAISCSAETMVLDELPLSGAHNPVQDIDKVVTETEMRCSVKRKMEDSNIGKEGRPQRAGVKNKRAKK